MRSKSAVVLGLLLLCTLMASVQAKKGKDIGKGKGKGKSAAAAGKKDQPLVEGECDKSKENETMMLGPPMMHFPNKPAVGGKCPDAGEVLCGKNCYQKELMTDAFSPHPCGDKCVEHDEPCKGKCKEHLELCGKICIPTDSKDDWRLCPSFTQGCVQKIFKCDFKCEEGWEQCNGQCRLKKGTEPAKTESKEGNSPAKTESKEGAEPAKTESKEGAEPGKPEPGVKVGAARIAAPVSRKHLGSKLPGK